MTSSHADIAFSAVAFGCATIACYHDIRARRIPNRLTAPAALTALLGHFALGGWAALGTAASAGLAAGFAMVLFFLAGGMGAGDVKLVASVACFTGLAPLPTFLLATAIAGALCALALAWHRGLLQRTFANAFRLADHHFRHGLTPDPEHNVRTNSGLRMPFAVPIAAGVLCTLALQLSAGVR